MIVFIRLLMDKVKYLFYTFVVHKKVLEKVLILICPITREIMEYLISIPAKRNKRIFNINNGTFEKSNE